MDSNKSKAGLKGGNTYQEKDTIHVIGARVHNLRNIDVSIPRNKFTVITGLSGSGKSSLAFDTIYAEGQRRYIETFSAYARQFLGKMERPDVDKISGLSPVISIEQKSTNKNPRSTVGTITEIYDFLRLLYARAGEAYSWESGEKMVKYTEDQIIDLILNKFDGKACYILAPVVKGRKGHYKELFEQIRRKGFLSARVNGEIIELDHGFKVDRYKTHFIEILIDKLNVKKEDRKRLRDSVQLAMKHGQGVTMILDKHSTDIKYYSKQLMCPTTGLSYNEPAPHTFSFNSPAGACSNCNGLGTVNEIDLAKVVPDAKLSIKEGGIAPLGKYRSTFIFWQLDAIAEKYKFSLSSSISKVPKEALDIVLYGSEESFVLKNTPLGNSSNYILTFEGVINYLATHTNEKPGNNSNGTNKWANQYITKNTCPSCNGKRLHKEALHFKIDNKNISNLTSMDIGELVSWFDNIEERLSVKQNQIAAEILKELRTRLGFLMDVGLEYLSLSRSAGSLSGGESQRIRLATQIGSKLVNVLYILDEPSIGLHQRDNNQLIKALQQLRDTGNSIIVVEHDKDMILSADYIVDMGPFAGIHGGEVVAEGDINRILSTDSLTSQYLNNKKKIDIPDKRRQGSGKYIVLKGATGNNLNNVNLKLPLGKFVCVTGVSGSGKSSLINETLHRLISQKLNKSSKRPLSYKSIAGLENIDKIIVVDQSPLGKTPRSNPATYTNVFGDIRKLFEMIPESKIRGYKAGRFSFNVKGGRCEICRGAGLKTIEMNFLPDVYVHCDDCNGRRYNSETLEVRFKGKSISDVLDMTINQAADFFDTIPSIKVKLKTLQDVGVGYLTLGQPSTTLSGGESQRIKLSSELAKRDTGKTLYILDEPTTGLHFEDISVLLVVLNKLVDRGNSIIVIEHNMDVIKVADYIIDIGPDGGRNGGDIIAEGTPEQVSNFPKSYTGQYLKKELNGDVII